MKTKLLALVSSVAILTSLPAFARKVGECTEVETGFKVILEHFKSAATIELYQGELLRAILDAGDKKPGVGAFELTHRTVKENTDEVLFVKGKEDSIYIDKVSGAGVIENYATQKKLSLYLKDCEVKKI